MLITEQISSLFFVILSTSDTILTKTKDLNEAFLLFLNYYGNSDASDIDSLKLKSFFTRQRKRSHPIWVPGHVDLEENRRQQSKI